MAEPDYAKHTGLRINDMEPNTAKVCAPSVAVRMKGGSIHFLTLKEAIDLWDSLAKSIDKLKREYPDR